MDKWIALKDRPPELGRNVLVTDGTDVSLAHLVKETRSYWDQVNENTQKKRIEETTYWSFAEDTWMDVSHWMEKPNPPTKSTSTPEETKNG